MERRFIGIREAAEFLGYSAGALYRMAKNREVPAYQPTGGGKILFDKDELAEWVRNSKTSQCDEDKG